MLNQIKPTGYFLPRIPVYRCHSNFRISEDIFNVNPALFCTCFRECNCRFTKLRATVVINVWRILLVRYIDNKIHNVLVWIRSKVRLQHFRSASTIWSFSIIWEKILSHFTSPSIKTICFAACLLLSKGTFVFTP